MSAIVKAAPTDTSGRVAPRTDPHSVNFLSDNQRES
jgi:hypothetical protein